MSVPNPFRSQIRSLSDVAAISECAATSYFIYLDHMETDPAHDDSHFIRVVRNALWFGKGGDPDVIVPAALLHDLVNLPKDHPERSSASRLSAVKADGLMKEKMSFKDSSYWPKLFNAIEAHSWSAEVEPTSLEACAVQDADRIDALGLVGIARLFSVGGSMNRTMFHPTDPKAQHRFRDEYGYTLDHYFTKLRLIPQSMKTEKGKIEACRLASKMSTFIDEMIDEL